MDLQIKAAVSFSEEYLNKVYGLLEPKLDEISADAYLNKYDQMEPFFELFRMLRTLTEDLDELETVDLIEDLIVKKNLPKFSDLNFVRTLNDLRLCALDDIVESKVIKARDFLVKLRYLFPYYRLVIDLETDLQLDYFEQSAYLQKEFLSLFPKLKDSFHFLLTINLETLDKLNLCNVVCTNDKIHDKLTQQRDDAEDRAGGFLLVDSSISEESDEDCSTKRNRIKLNELDKVLLNERLYVVKSVSTTNENDRTGQRRDELIIGEINYEPENKANNFISTNFEGKHCVLMLLSMKSTINVINRYTFNKLNSMTNQTKQCLVDLAINGVELGLQHAFVLAVDAYFGFVKVKMNYFYFDELEMPIIQNLIGNGFIEHIHSLSPYNYFTLKEEPDTKHLFLCESDHLKMIKCLE